MPTTLPPLLLYAGRLPWVLSHAQRWCGRELTNLHLSDCYQGIDRGLELGDPGFSMRGTLLKPLPSFWEPPLVFIMGLGEHTASGKSTLYRAGCWGLVLTKMGRGAVALWGGKESLWAIRAWKASGVFSPPSPEVVVDSSTSPGRWEEEGQADEAQASVSVSGEAEEDLKCLKKDIS